MESRSLQSSTLTQIGRPEKWEEKFLIKRFDEEPIEISLRVRDAILVSLSKGDRFVQVGKHTLMLNAIKSIDPKWGEKNIPPRPKPIFMLNGSKVDYQMDENGAENQTEIDEWDKLFKKT